MLKSMSIYYRDNNGIVNFVISCLTQLSLTLLHHVLLLRAQFEQTPTSPKSRLGTVEKIYSIVTSPFYTIPQQGITCFSICSLLQWYFSYLDYATVPYNNILDNIANGNTHKLKGFLCCYRSNKNHLECTHSLRQSCESPHQTESPISLYKDSQTYNSSFSKDTRVYV